MVANFSVEKVIDMVTSNSDVDENKEFEELDMFETKIMLLKYKQTLIKTLLKHLWLGLLWHMFNHLLQIQAGAICSGFPFWSVECPWISIIYLNNHNDWLL